MAQFVVIIPDVRVWGGEKTMRVDGITAELPDELFRETLKLIPKEFKAPFETKRKAARRILEKRGIQFAGGVGFVVAAEEIQSVDDELNALKGEFFDYLEGTFLPQVKDKILAHAKQFPEWEKRILSHAPDLEKIRSAFEFKWLVTDIGGEHASVLSEVGMFERQLYRETADAAREILNRMRERNGSCNRKTVEAIRGIAKKIEGLKFIDPKILPLARGINAALNAHLPAEGPLTDDDKIVVQSLLLTMASAESMSLAAETVASGGDFWVKPVIKQPLVVATATPATAPPEVATNTGKTEDDDKAPVSLVAAVAVTKRNDCFF